MNNTVKIAIAGGLGIAVGIAIGYALKTHTKEKTKEVEGLDQFPKEFIVKPTKKAEQPKAPEPKVEGKPTIKQEDIKTPAVLKDDSFPLEYGSSGERVQRLQIYLMRKLGWVRRPTGVFDGTTLLRVKQCFKTTEVNQETYQNLMLDKMVHDQHKNN